LIGKELAMAEDIIDLLENYIPADNRRKWAKLSSTVDSRRLELLLLREILLEMRKMNQLLQMRAG
jgi:hypothetical protein